MLITNFLNFSSVFAESVFSTVDGKGADPGLIPVFVDELDADKSVVGLDLIGVFRGTFGSNFGACRSAYRRRT